MTAEWWMVVFEAFGVLIVVVGLAVSWTRLAAQIESLDKTLTQMRSWMSEHEDTLDDHGNRIARIEGRLGVDS